MDKIFINCYNYNSDWIMGIIADDIRKNAELLGYQCRCGKFEDYNDEEICYHLNYAIAVPIPQAKHNSVFYTHLNHALSEKNLVAIKDKFDSFICMSPEDAEFLIELGFDEKKVFGKTLPVRNTYIKPVSIGIFSICYPDGRKNEQWLIDYCQQCEDAKNINFVFMGRGWGKVCSELENLGCSYEWHNASRRLPFEYQFQQNKLACLNYYIYMGMDGGAMGSYDAYAQDVPLCITYDGFHKSIPDVDYVFDDKKSFFDQMNIIINKHKNRLDFFLNNNAESYVRWIIDVWNGKASSEVSDKDKDCISYHTVLEKKRNQYYKINLTKILNYIHWNFSKLLFKKRYKLNG